jgi:SdrD B-like protein
MSGLMAFRQSSGRVKAGMAIAATLALVTTLGVSAFMLAKAPAVHASYTGCPAQEALDNWLVSNDMEASYTTSSNMATYTFTSSDEGSNDGIPGLIEYCIYTSPMPDNVTVEYDSWVDPGGPPPPAYFAFQRPDGGGDPSNLPFDGSTQTMGTATWSDGVPSSQTIVLHINDPAECDRLYGGNPGTCFVKPGTIQTHYHGSLSGAKYYDANIDGQDVSEVGINGWKVVITDCNGNVVDTEYTNSSGNFGPVQLDPGTYCVAEVQSSGWTQTGNTVDQTSTSGGASESLQSFVYTVTIPSDHDSTVTNLNFGNVCYVAPGGLTIGFWSNKNGQANFTPADLAALVAFNLRNANGSNFDPASYTQYRSWLLNANATNMAYMLSAQMSATYLNIQHGFTNANVIVDGTRTVAQEITYANGLLGADGFTLSGNLDRTEQERVKNIFDKINNGGSFLQPGPGTCPALNFG